MTARRGSLRFKVTRIAALRGADGSRRGASSPAAKWQRAMNLSGRVLAASVVTLAALTFAVQAWRIGYQNYQLHQQVVAVENENQALRRQSVTLRREIYLSRNPEYLVPLIHEQLGLAKPHEVFVRFAPMKPTAP